MKTLVSIVVALAFAGVLVVDGLGMYGGHRLAVEAAQGAAELAADVFVSTGGSETAAEEAAQELAKQAGVEVESVRYKKAETERYEVTVVARPDTILLDHIPGVRDWIKQEATAVAHLK